jgi:cell division protein FtsB
MKAPLSRIVYVLAIVVVASFAVFSLAGPRGIPSLAEKKRQIQTLERRNEELVKDVERTKDRIRRMESDPDEQERVIKERLKLVGPGEKVYVLPDAAKN